MARRQQRTRPLCPHGPRERARRPRPRSRPPPTRAIVATRPQPLLTPASSEQGQSPHTHMHTCSTFSQTDPSYVTRDKANSGGLPHEGRGGHTLTTVGGGCAHRSQKSQITRQASPLFAQPVLGLAVQWGGRYGVGTGSLASSPCGKAGNDLPGAAGEAARSTDFRLTGPWGPPRLTMPQGPGVRRGS